MTEENEKYFSLAMTVAKTVLTNREGAVSWWKEEAAHREKHGLSADQVDQISGVLAERFPSGAEA